jgi:hypothetical protein
MFFIQAEAVEEKAFASWVKREEILPPVGVSKGGMSILEYTWAIKSLPCLILTDKNHIVTDKGFSITELDEKIKQ